MAQRTAFAAARAGGARILIADEPTKGLDASLRSSVVATLRTTFEGGGALLTITHDVSVAEALGGRLGVMLDGRIIEEGDAPSVLTRPRHDYTRRLVAADPARWPDRARPPVGDLVLTGHRLGKRFGSHQLFAGVDVEIRRGEAVAVTGPSGSGKTTLGNILLGLRRSDQGHVARAKGIDALKLQKLYQDPVASFPPHATLRRTMRDLVERHSLTWTGVETLLARLKLSHDLLDRRPDQVSGGELQRFALVRVLLMQPALLFADEPTSRLDPITQAETMDLLAQQCKDQGVALLLVTHDTRIAHNMTSLQLPLGGLA
jgi:peptide/nickel transport system ATP-binding protein